MKYGGTLIAVADMDRAKGFYGILLEQKIVMDLGTHVLLENGLSLQSDYAGLVGEPLQPRAKPDNFQLYFEVESFDAWRARLRAVGDLVWLHDSKEYPWGQRVMRFYDCDQYIVEVSESMESVARRFLAQGFTAEQVAERTMFPVELVRALGNV